MLKKYVLRHKAFLLVIIAGCFLWARVLGCCAPGVAPVREPGQLPDALESALEYTNPDPEAVPAQGQDPEAARTAEPASRPVTGYRWELVRRFDRTLYATCYSQEDSPVEARGIYANNKYAELLHRSERRIQRHHWTVALPPELKQYHEALVFVNGAWTHRWRVHVPGYNTQDKTRGPDAGYWAVPRDRMRQAGRIDVLFTTAGGYATIKQRQTAWARMNTHNTECEFWEYVKVPIYEKGKP